MSNALRILSTVGAIVAVCYFGRMVLIPLALAAFLAITVAPAVALLERIHVPRALGAAMVLLTLAAGVWGAGELLYARVVDLAHQVPRYSRELRDVVQRVQKPAEQVQETTQRVLSPGPEPRSTVRVAQPFDWAGVLHSLGAIGEVLLAATFVPFLAFFMLSGQHKLRDATVKLFPIAHQADAADAFGEIAQVVRRFILVNLVLGAVMGGLFALLYWKLGLANALVLGLVSGFANLVPYLGAALASFLPLAAGIGKLSATGVVAVMVSAFGLHILTLNLAYPKLVGARMQLNPLAGTVALLVWAGLWGPIGLVLAMPITAGFKVACDRSRTLQPWGVWLGM
jgi:predicted PurR-regulated permease PerM